MEVKRIAIWVVNLFRSITTKATNYTKKTLN